MYQWNAADYHKNSEAQRQWADELLSKLDLVGNERVLDVGCGDGKITAALARQLPRGRVLGIDSAAEMIDFARRSFPPEEFPNLSFAVADARFLNYRSEFDVVFSNAALHWVTDHLPVLTGIKRCLQSPGKMLIQMGGKGNIEEFRQALESATRDKKWRRYFTDFSFPYGFFSVEEYRHWLAIAGFQIQRVELIPKVMAQKGKSGLIAWIRTTCLPYTQRVPQEVRDQFIHEAAEAYLRQHPVNNEGIVQVKMVRLEVEASV